MRIDLNAPFTKSHEWIRVTKHRTISFQTVDKVNLGVC